ncbi:6-phosphofructo-2-kinase [Martiniozyma asiatica (nom. inval.)]|nr:6-phosphofructo-2-kinase [Martiniozyma asiatica]
MSEDLKLVIVCVGLPARGKSYITKKLQRYLKWAQYSTSIFNVGNTRRKDETQHSADFFDHANPKNAKVREQWAKDTLNNLLDFLLLNDGNVGIFDATNTTKARRRLIVETINKRTNGQLKILFLESICTDQALIEKNIHLKLSGPDYKDMDPEIAVNDFRQRVKNYEKVYQTIDEQEEQDNEKYDVQYVKIINAGMKVISYNISGYLASQCVFFLLNFNLTDRQIWLTTNGVSLDNLNHIKGGDSGLSEEGQAFAKALPKFITQKRREFKLSQFNKGYLHDTTSFNTSKTQKRTQQFNVWTSTLKRTIETVHYFSPTEYHFKSFRILNNLACGAFDGMSNSQFKHMHHEEYLESIKNKLSYRFPGLTGESYLDVISRLKPIIIELERLKDHVLIVSHRIIIRVLLCYYMNLNKEMLTELDVQHGYVYCIEPKPYGMDLNVWKWDYQSGIFYEVDVSELMMRRRKSEVLNDVDRLRHLLLTQNSAHSDPHQSDNDYDSDIERSSSDYSSSSDDDDDNGIFSLNFIRRSDSQSYEFGSRTLSATDLKILSNTDLRVRALHQKKESIDWDSPKRVDSGLLNKVDDIMGDDELVKELRKRLQF